MSTTTTLPPRGHLRAGVPPRRPRQPHLRRGNGRPPAPHNGSSTPLAHDVDDRLARMYESLWHGAVRYAQSLGADVHLAHDLVSEAFIRTWLQLRAGRRIDAPEKYVLTTVRNLFVDDLRKMARICCVGDDGLQALVERNGGPQRTPADAVADTSEMATLLDALSERHRQVLLLVAHGGMTMSEIAVAMGLSGPGAASALLLRARRAAMRLHGSDAAR